MRVLGDPALPESGIRYSCVSVSADGREPSDGAPWGGASTSQPLFAEGDHTGGYDGGSVRTRAVAGGSAATACLSRLRGMCGAVLCSCPVSQLRRGIIRLSPGCSFVLLCSLCILWELLFLFSVRSCRGLSLYADFVCFVGDLGTNII